MKIQKVGFFFELEPEVQRAELHRLRSRSSHPDKLSILEYLRSGVDAGAVMMIDYDYACEPKATIGAIVLKSDGRWIWPNSLAYYFEKYDVQLPEQFVLDMRSLDWVVPSNVEIPFEMPQGHVAM